jgi:RND family efflux transporter MFP subunit
MSRQLKWALLLLVGAVAIVAAMIMLRPTPTEEPQEASVPLVQTMAYSVGSGAVEVDATGSVQPREEVTLGVEVSGKLVFVDTRFREGSMVGDGTILFRIDPSDYRNRVRSAQADVAAQDVAVLQAQEEVAIASDELRRFSEREAGRNALAQAVDENDYAARILPPAGLQSGNSAGQQGTVSPNNLATREPQLRSAEAARERAAAQLADAQLALSRTEVRAPFRGVVRSESASIGTIVQPGQSLGSIVAVDAYEVRVSLTEDEAALIPGLFAARRAPIAAQVFVEYGGATYRWNAVVDRADAILDPETRTIDVFLRVPNPLSGGALVEADGDVTGRAPPLLLGSFVEATITGTSEQPYASIPIEALRPGNQVWIVRNGKLSIVSVNVIQRGDRVAFVSAPGLGESGQIVTSALRTPVNGMDVRTQANGQSNGIENDE